MGRFGYEQTAELFFDTYIKHIKKGDEIPNFNFVFQEEAYGLLRQLMQSSICLIDKKDYDFLMNSHDPKAINVVVHDYKLFFNLLDEIIEAETKLSIDEDGNLIGLSILRYIWLRMGIEDVVNVEKFLQRQLEFLKDRTFHNPEYTLVGKYYNSDVYMKTDLNLGWDESYRSMQFVLLDNSGTYTLPRVLYDIDADGTCYVFGVQNSYKNKNKKLERKVYKANSGIENPINHPNKVLALLLFIEELRKKGIYKLVVPTIQVLSYPYHEVLSKNAWKHRKDDKNFFNRFYKKQDLISKIKTEDLMYLIYGLAEHDPNLEVINEVNLQGDSLVIKNRTLK